MRHLTINEVKMCISGFMIRARTFLVTQEMLILFSNLLRLRFLYTIISLAWLPKWMVRITCGSAAYDTAGMPQTLIMLYIIKS